MAAPWAAALSRRKRPPGADQESSAEHNGFDLDQHVFHYAPSGASALRPWAETRAAELILGARFVPIDDAGLDVADVDPTLIIAGSRQLFAGGNALTRELAASAYMLTQSSGGMRQHRIDAAIV